MPCVANVCGTGGWTGPKPGDPDNNSVLTATSAFGGVDVAWTYPVTNPFAVAHTEIYRGTASNFELAVHHKVTAANFFFDAVETQVTYYYWIKFVSINGTYGEPIGPASSMPQLSIDRTIEQLTGQIHNGLLAQTLRDEIAGISLLSSAISQEVQDRLLANEAFGAAMTGMLGNIDTTQTLLGAEVTQRSAENAALVGSLTLLNNNVNSALNVSAAGIVATDKRVTEVIDTARELAAQARTSAKSMLYGVLAAEKDRLAASNSVVFARQELTQDFQAGLYAEASYRLALAAKLDTDVGSALALIAQESNARSTAVSAEATQRDLLAAQFRGNYTGTNPAEITEGLFFQERTARASENAALAQQITLLSAGAGEQFDWASIWYFDTSDEGWTGNGTPIAANGFLQPADGTNPYVISPDALALDGSKYSQLRLRIRKYGTPVWAGELRWTTPELTSFNETNLVALTEPTYDGKGIGLVTVTPAWAGVINRIRLDLSTEQSGASYFSIDWVAIGRPSPGASSAQLATLEEVMTSSISSVASRTTSLEATVGNNSTGLVKSVATIVGDYVTNAGLTSAASSAQTTLLAQFGPSKVFREAGVAVLNGDDTGGPVQVANYTPIVLANGTTTYLPKVSLGNVWYNTTNGNKPHSWDGLNWKYTPDVSATATKAYADNLVTALATPTEATVTALNAISASYIDPVSGQPLNVSTLNDQLKVVAGENKSAAIASRTLRSESKKLGEAQLKDILSGAKLAKEVTGTLALVREELTTQIVDGVAAEAVKRTALIAAVNDSIAVLNNTQSTLATAQSSTSTSLTQLASTVGTNSADILAAQTTQTTDREANAAALVALASEVGDNLAGVLQSYYTKVTADGVTAAAINSLKATMESPGGSVGSLAATLDTQYYTKVNTDGAISSAATQLKAYSDLGVKTFNQATAPTIRGVNTTVTPNVNLPLVMGDVWVDSNDKKHYSWSGTAWVAASDTAAFDAWVANDFVTAQTQIDAKTETWFQDADPAASWATALLKQQHTGDLWYSGTSKLFKRFLSTAPYATGSWTTIEDKAAIDAAAAASTAQTTADGKIVTFTKNGAPIVGNPAAAAVGDLCIDTSTTGKNALYRWSGSAWVDIRDGNSAAAFASWITATYDVDKANIQDGKIESWFGTTDPSLSWSGTIASHTGDLWYNDTSKLLKRWGGVAWVTIQDKVAVDAAAAASTAQETADGKIVTFVGTSAPTAKATGDLWIDSDDENKMYRWSGSAWVTMRDTSASAQITTLEQTKIGYATKAGVAFDNGGLITNKAGVDAWNAANPSTPAVWNIGLPLATAVKQVSVTDPVSGTVALEQAFIAQKTVNGDLKGQYTVKVSAADANGVKTIGGFGVYGDPTGIEAGFDVDRFWVGRSAVDVNGNVTKVKPFIVEGDEVFMDQAVINKLTFSKLRSASGGVVIEGDKLKAQHVDTVGLTIRSAEGSILLDAGSGYFSGKLSAGTVDFTSSIGSSNLFTTPGTYTVTVPSTTPQLRISLVGGGGGGGGQNAYWYGFSGSGGGGGGGFATASFVVIPGTVLTIVVGAGGGGGGYGGWGQAGGTTQVVGYLSAGGGGGGNASKGAAYPGQGGAAGGQGATAGGVAPGKGGNSRMGIGGLLGTGSGYYQVVYAGTGFGGGGGGTIDTGYGINGGTGSGGYALLEFYDPNGLVLKAPFDLLKTELRNQGMNLT